MLHRLRQTRSSPRGTAPQTWWSRDCAHRPVSTPHNPPVCLSHWSPRPASQPIKIPTSYPLDRQIKSGESSGLLTCWLLEHVTGQDLATIRVHGLSHWWPPQIVRTSYPRHASPSTTHGLLVLLSVSTHTTQRSSSSRQHYEYLKSWCWASPEQMALVYFAADEMPGFLNTAATEQPFAKHRVIWHCPLRATKPGYSAGDVTWLPAVQNSVVLLPP